MPAVLPTDLADGDPIAIVVACFFLLIFVVGGAYAVMWLRKRIWSTEETEIAPMGFTLGDLRQLHRSGKLTDQEFQHAREKIVAAAQRAATPDSGKAPPPGPHGPSNPPASAR
jgi:hypothetical protein